MGNGLSPQALADGAGDAAERFGELAVGACLPAGDLAYCSPGAAPEVAPLLSEREVEPVVGVGEVTRPSSTAFSAGMPDGCSAAALPGRKMISRRYSASAMMPSAPNGVGRIAEKGACR